ncbi:MAG: hypothetical protein KF878_08145 [Planctomycetes bacterium]|nr:hypothetical protein [Planctomycetota bacterium]
MSSDPQAVEDLYTKIALDNKLVTRFQVRKAAEELDSLAKGGKKKPPLGEVMVRLGFLSERQHQSVVNACRYREQRDLDKRFGRQCLRMELLQQADIERALDAQKDAYQGKGKVEGLAEILVAQGKLTSKQAADVRKGIDERDRAKARSGNTRALSASGPTPVLKGAPEAPARPAPARPAPAADDDADDDDLKDVDLDDDDLDEADLDDAGADLDGVDLDDDDLKDDDLKDDDLKDDDLKDDDLKDVDLDEDDLDDDDLKGVDLDDDDLKDVDLDEDDDDLDGVNLDEDLDDDEDKLDIDPAKLDDLVEKVAAEGGEDEADLAEDVSEIGSDVDLDEDDLRAIERMDSGDEMETDGAWAAEAFDDRPISQRPASERLARRALEEPARAGSERTQAAAPPAPTQPPAPPVPPRRPEPELAATASSPFQSADDVAAPPPPPPATIPGGDVFDSGLSGSRAASASHPADDDEDVPVPALDDEVPLSASEVGRMIDAGRPVDDARDDDDDEEAALRDRLRQSARRLEEAMSGDSARHAAAAAVAAPPVAPARSAPVEAAAPVAPAAPAAAVAPATNGAALRTDDPRVRRAFDKALEAAWKVFVEELRS